MTFWKRMKKKFEERESEELRRRKQEEEARKRIGYEAEMQGVAAGHQEAETADEPLEDAEPNPFCRYNK